MTKWEQQGIAILPISAWVTLIRKVLRLYGVALRHRVVPMSAPRVAAADALKGKPTTFKRTVLFNGLYAVLAAGRLVAAARRQQWR